MTLSTKTLLQDRKIINYMEMILKKFIWEQFICGKFYTIKSNKNKFIIQPRNRSLKNIKITMRKEEIFIRIEKNFKKIERSFEINIDNNQIMMVISIIEKILIETHIYQYLIIKSVVIHYLINAILIYILMMKWDI